MSSWSIVSTVNEEPEVLSVFIQHHLAIGCQEIHLYFDNPADSAKSLFSGDSRVRISDGSQDPVSHERKQSLNATDAYQHCRSEWLIHMDADEMLSCEKGVAAALSTIDPAIRQLNLPPWEAVFSDACSAGQPFSAVLFRSRLKPAGQADTLQKQYYPEVGPAMRSGLAGHLAGKSFIRKTNPNLRAAIHFWKSTVEGEEIPVHRVRTGIRLLHFDAISFPQWKRKLERRIRGNVVMTGMDAHRLAQLEAFGAASRQGGEDALKQLFNQLYTIRPEMVPLLKKQGVLRKLEWRRTEPEGVERTGYERITTRPTEAEKEKSISAIRVVVQEARKLLAAGNVGQALAALEKAALPEAVIHEPCGPVVEIHQLISWILIHQGRCREARGYLERIGRSVAGDHRKKLAISPGFAPRRMVFICGLHRSGTTLIEHWLQAYYSCATLRAKVPENEGQFLQDVYCDERPFGGPGKFAFSNAMHGLPPGDEPTARAHERRIRQGWESWISGDEDVLIEKSPPNITRINYLRTVFPGSKFIVWTRDPRAVSLATMKWSKTSYHELLLHWHVAYSAALCQMDDDCLIVRYEDFCEAPDTVISKVAAFAGLDKRPVPNPIGKRFTEVRNTNANYLATAPASEIKMPFKSWKSFGYEFG